jgi:hypothetical protein
MAGKLVDLSASGSAFLVPRSSPLTVASRGPGRSDPLLTLLQTDRQTHPHTHSSTSILRTLTTPGTVAHHTPMAIMISSRPVRGRWTARPPGVSGCDGYHAMSRAWPRSTVKRYSREEKTRQTRAASSRLKIPSRTPSISLGPTAPRTRMRAPVWPSSGRQSVDSA